MKDDDGYQLLPPARPVKRAPRPADIMPEFTDDRRRPPSEGGPWTDLHAGVYGTLQERLREAQRRKDEGR